MYNLKFIALIVHVILIIWATSQHLSWFYLIIVYFSDISTEIYQNKYKIFLLELVK